MIIRKCSTKGAFEAFPEKNIQLDLSKLKSFKAIATTPFLVIIKDKFEVTCFKTGRLLIKNCANKGDAEKQAVKIYKKLGVK